MISSLPAHTVHLDKLPPSNEMAFAIIGNPQNAPRYASGSADDDRRNVVLFASLANYLRRLFAYLGMRIYECFYPQALKGGDVYKEVPLSPASRHRLAAVGRKTLVLDLDETLVHSCYTDPDTMDCIGCSQVPEQALADYVINVVINGAPPIPFRVFKRPHVDFFLNLVSKWYDLVIYTASLESYAAQVVDLLDDGRGLLPRRLYRQHCRSTMSLFTKDLTLVSEDMRGVFIIDNSPVAYMEFPNNALPIKTFVYDPGDTELLKLLPFLDALRFTNDVRSVLSRRVAP